MMVFKYKVINFRQKYLQQQKILETFRFIESIPGAVRIQIDFEDAKKNPFIYFWHCFIVDSKAYSISDFEKMIATYSRQKGYQDLQKAWRGIRKYLYASLKYNLKFASKPSFQDITYVLH